MAVVGKAAHEEDVAAVKDESAEKREPERGVQKDALVEDILGGKGRKENVKLSHKLKYLGNIYMSGETESKTSTTSSTAAEEERKERIIKLKRKIKSDAEIIEQIKDDISKMDDNELKKSLNSTKVALEKEKKDNEDTIKNMSLTPLQQRHAEVQKARKEAGVSSDAFLSTFAQHLYPKKKVEKVKVATATRDTNRPWRRTRKWFGGKRKTKRKIRTRRKKRTKRRRTRRRRSKKRRTRRRRKRRRGGTMYAHGPTKMYAGSRKKRGGTGGEGAERDTTMSHQGFK